jgi:hypothetical protein
MSIFIRRVHGEPVSPRRCRCGRRRSAAPALAADLRPEELRPRRDPQRKVEHQRRPVARALGIERRVVLLQAVEHAGHRLLDDDARADLALVRARHRASSPSVVDDRLALGRVGHPAEGHLGAGHHAARVGQVTLERRLVERQPEFFIASLNSNPGTTPAFAPNTPASDGPMPFLPGSIEWHALHTANAAGSVTAAVVGAADGEALAVGVGVALAVSLGVGVASAAAVSVATGAAVAAECPLRPPRRHPLHRHRMRRERRRMRVRQRTSKRPS